MKRIIVVSLVLAALALGQKGKEPEYKVVSTSGSSIEKVLNAHSAKGWTYVELASYDSGPNKFYHLIFRR
jgi:hypothetical protein